MSSTTHWLPPPPPPSSSSVDAATANAGGVDVVDALCVGTGRFLRSVLVPALVGAGFYPALVQTRGRSFLEYMNATATTDADGRYCYEVDTVLEDGLIRTDNIPCYGAFSLGQSKEKEAFVEWLQTLHKGCVQISKLENHAIG
jgi:hypothetical protein